LNITTAPCDSSYLILSHTNKKIKAYSHLFYDFAIKCGGERSAKEKRIEKANRCPQKPFLLSYQPKKLGGAVLFNLLKK
jgi:hypothetical protein